MNEALPSDARPAAAADPLPRRLWWTVAVALAVAGVWSRLYGAWGMRHITDSDCGVVGLMVRNMAAFREWPVFFYGQAYMGTFEPAVSALAARLFGVNGFAVNLGPALLAIGALAWTAVWARWAGGRAALLAALALMAIGPRDFYMFQFAARGGYMAALFFATAVLALSVRAAARARAGEPVGLRAYLWIGLLAGLGWWQSQMMLSTLITAGLVLAVGLRGRVWGREVAAGAAGFLAGSAPFWLWNARHDWATFRMAGGVGNLSPAEGVRLLGVRMLRMVGLESWPEGARIAMASAYGALALLALVVAAVGLVRAWRKGGVVFTPAALAVGAAGIQLALSLGFFCTSSFARFNTARYLVPAYPSVVVLAGALAAALVTAWPRRRLGGVLAAGWVMALAATHVPALAVVREYARGNPAREQRQAELEAMAVRQEIQAFYANVHWYALNFMSAERLVVTPVTGERYDRNRERMEAADRIAVLDNHGGIEEFLSLSGGDARRRTVAGLAWVSGFKPPAGGLAEIPPARWAAVRDLADGNPGLALQDRRLDIAWVPVADADGRVGVEIRLHAPEVLRMARVQGPPEGFPARLAVEILPAEGGDWVEVHARHAASAYHWSGPRPFFGGRRGRIEMRFADRSVRGVRFLHAAGPARPEHQWQVSEISLFGPGPDEASEVEALSRLLERLDELQVERLYADRWVSNKVHAHTDGGIWVDREGATKKPYRGVVPGAGAWALIRKECRAMTQEALAQAGVEEPLRAEDIGPWVLMDLSRVPASARLDHDGCALRPVPAWP